MRATPCRGAAHGAARAGAAACASGLGNWAAARQLQPAVARQPSGQHIGIEAALDQDVGGGGAAPAGVAIDDVWSVAVERRELQPDQIERHVERPLDGEGLVLARQPYVEPAAAARDDRLRLIARDPLQERLVHELAEILL